MERNFKVWCNTDDELNEVLTQAGRDGFTWASGHNPLDYKMIELETPVGIVFVKEHIYYAGTRESFDDPRAGHIAEVSVQDYTKNGRPDDIPTGTTVELKRGRLLEILDDITKSDESTRKLIEEAPLLLALIGVMVVKIEDELFKDEPVDKMLS